MAIIYGNDGSVTVTGKDSASGKSKDVTKQVYPTPEQRPKEGVKPATSSSTSTTSKSSGVKTWEQYEKGNTPYEQIEQGKGEFGAAYQRLGITVSYNPQGIEKTLNAPSGEEAQAIYRKESQVAVARREEERNTQMLQQSAIADFISTGFFGTRGEGNEVYLTEKGQRLGYEKMYELEEGAVWGKSFDFYFEGEQVYQLPEGTRASMKGSGLSRPYFITKGEQKYLVAQKEGGETIEVQAINPFSNRLSAKEEKSIYDFLEGTRTGETIASYKEEGGEIKVKITPTDKGEYIPTNKEKMTAALEERAEGFFSQTPINEYVYPKPTLGFQYGYAELASGRQLGLEYVETPVGKFFQTDYSKIIAGKVAEGENWLIENKPPEVYMTYANQRLNNQIDVLSPARTASGYHIFSIGSYLTGKVVETPVKGFSAMGLFGVRTVQTAAITGEGSPITFKRSESGRYDIVSTLKWHPERMMQGERNIIASEFYDYSMDLMLSPITVVATLGFIGEASLSTTVVKPVLGELPKKGAEQGLMSYAKAGITTAAISGGATYSIESLWHYAITPGEKDRELNALLYPAENKETREKVITMTAFGGAWGVGGKFLGEQALPAIKNTASKLAGNTGRFVNEFGDLFEINYRQVGAYKWQPSQAPPTLPASAKPGSVLTRVSTTGATSTYVVPSQGAGVTYGIGITPIISYPARQQVNPAGQFITNQVRQPSTFGQMQLTPKQKEYNMKLQTEGILESRYTLTRFDLSQMARSQTGQRNSILARSRSSYKVGVGLLTPTRATPRVTQIPFIGVGVTTRQAVGVGVRVKLGFPALTRTPTVPVITLPNLSASSDDFRKSSIVPKTPKFSKGYAPSVWGIDIGRKEKNKKKLYTGLEVRGL